MTRRTSGGAGPQRGGERSARTSRFFALFAPLAAFSLLASPDWYWLVSRAGALTLFGTWIVLGRRAIAVRRLLTLDGVLGIVGLLLVVNGGSPFVASVGGALVLAALASIRVERSPCSRASALTGALYCVAWAAYLANPCLFTKIRDAATGWSGLVGSAFSCSLRIGPSMQGAWLGLLALSLLLARFTLVERRWHALAAGLAVLVAANICLLRLLAAYGETIPTASHAILPWIVVGWPALAVVCWMVSQSGESTRRTGRTLSRTPSALLAVGALAALALAGSSHLVRSRPSPRVLLYSLNEGPILNWDRPHYGEYGAYSLGMFGLLPEYLESDGYLVEFLNEPLEAEHLADVDVLVTINVDTDWSSEELAAIEHYVRGGGSLLVLGDHTDANGTRSSHNSLLSMVGIEFNFDSSVPANRTGWDRSDAFFHALHAGMDHGGELGIAVGATLELLEPGALPLLVGRHGLADRGDPDAPDRAYLGDYEYQHGELLGDVVLTAWSRLGAGRVLVFGDTSSLQNGPLQQTYLPHVRRMFAWTTGATVWDLGIGGTIAAGIAFLLLAGLLLWTSRNEPRTAALFALAVLATRAGTEDVQESLLARGDGRLDHPIALLDESHFSGTDFRADGPRNVSGLRNSLVRSGYFVQTLDEFDEEALERAQLLVSIAPVRAYTPFEVDALERFMTAGGTVIVAAGHPDRTGVAPLLDAVGISIMPLPIGPVPLDRDPRRPRDRVGYVSAWPLRFAERCEKRTTVYGSFMEYPLAALVEVGRGALFVVGDSYFFGSPNLEGFDDWSEPNIEFVRDLLSHVASLGDRSGE
ncbi:MAG: hypothetical protein KDC38_02660 [Planctomycetes bacterium]|nr:hypothetical protein [Planctomycetota bacterium]